MRMCESPDTHTRARVASCPFKHDVCLRATSLRLSIDFGVRPLYHSPATERREGDAPMAGGVDTTLRNKSSAWYAGASSSVDLLLRYRDAMACRIAHGKALPAGFDDALFQKVDAAATRSICAAFQGGGSLSQFSIWNGFGPFARIVHQTTHLSGQG
jgi:hypothetical protein